LQKITSFWGGLCPWTLLGLLSPRLPDKPPSQILKLICPENKLASFKSHEDPSKNYRKILLTDIENGRMNKTSSVAEMGDRATANWAEKWGRLLCPFPWCEGVSRV